MRLSHAVTANFNKNIICIAEDLFQLKPSPKTLLTKICHKIKSLQEIQKIQFAQLQALFRALFDSVGRHTYDVTSSCQDAALLLICLDEQKCDSDSNSNPLDTIRVTALDSNTRSSSRHLWLPLVDQASRFPSAITILFSALIFCHLQLSIILGLLHNYSQSFGLDIQPPLVA